MIPRRRRIRGAVLSSALLCQDVVTATSSAQHQEGRSMRNVNALSSCRDASGPSGVYEISGEMVLCDTVTNGGGWTLVYSGNAPPSDYGGPWYEDLRTLQPARRDGRPGYLWWELYLSPSISDFRTSCSLHPCEEPANCSFAVDISFYDTLWYNNIASGKDDAETCFGLERIYKHFRAPLRCNLLTGECTDKFWSSGSFEGEGDCDAPGDFTVDFNDRGKDSNETDGTDWGLDDGVWKCADRACDPLRDNCSWFIWVRQSNHGTDLFDRIFGVTGWFSVIFYLFGFVFAGVMPCFALGCARCCFGMASGLTESKFETAARRYTRPSHSEGNYPHYIARTRVVVADVIDEEDEERYVQERYLAAETTNGRDAGRPSPTGPSPTAPGPTPTPTTAPEVVHEEVPRHAAPMHHAAGAWRSAPGSCSRGEPAVSVQDRTHQTGLVAYEAPSAEQMGSRRALELT